MGFIYRITACRRCSETLRVRDGTEDTQIGKRMTRWNDCQIPSEVGVRSWTLLSEEADREVTALIPWLFVCVNKVCVCTSPSFLLAPYF
jgi:hypothetical protein